MDEWLQGFNDAVAYCRANYKPFQPMKLPDKFQHRANSWSCGFGEGMLTTKNKIIDEAYPGNVGFTTDGKGKVTLMYPEGHPALNKQQ